MKINEANVGKCTDIENRNSSNDARVQKEHECQAQAMRFKRMFGKYDEFVSSTSVVLSLLIG